MPQLTGKPRPGGAIDRSHPLAQGLLGLWTFAEGAGPSAFNSAGPRPLAWQDPAVSWGLSTGGPMGTFLDGANYGVTAGILAAAQPFSIAFRISTTQPTVTSALMFGMVSLGTSPTDGAPLYLLQQQVNAGIRVLLGAVAYRTMVLVPPVDTWYVMSSTWDGANESHYVAGLLQYQGARTLGGGITYPSRLWVGTGFNGAAQGWCDWVALWGRSLSPAEHAAIGIDPTAIMGVLLPAAAPSTVILMAPPAAGVMRRTLYARAGSRGVA